MRFFKILILCLTISATSSAQISDPVTIDNYSSVANEIVNYYQNLPNFNVNSGEIKSFFALHFNTSTYQPNCIPPEGNITAMDDNTISLDWTGPALSDEYRISYLSLEDANSSGTQITSNTNADILGLPNGLYLLTLQSICGSRAGALDIIIVEKPVLLQFALRNCPCLNRSKILHNTSRQSHGDEEPVRHDWGTITPGYNVYKIYVEYKINDTDTWYSKYTMAVDFSSFGTPGNVFVAKRCTTNVAVDQDAPGILQSTYPSNGSNVELFSSNAAHFAFLNEEMQFDPSNLLAIEGHPSVQFVDWKYRAVKCTDNNATRRSDLEDSAPSDAISITATPNPSQEATQIQYELPQDGKVHLTLYSDLGQVLRVFDPLDHLAGTHHFSLDWKDLPTGNYLFRVQTQEDSKIIRLAKTK